MPPEPAPESPDLLYEDDGARIQRRETRSFLHFRVSGRVTPALVRRLRRVLYQRPRGNLAVETGDLAGVNAAFVGQLRMIAREVTDRGDAFVLVDPGERVRDLLALGGLEQQVRILADAAELTDDLAALEGRARLIREAADELARESSSSAIWRMRDRDGVWLCPLCGAFCPGVRPPDAGEWPMRALEAAAAHLLDDCGAYDSGGRRPQSVRVLQARLAQRDAHQQRTARAHVAGLEAKVSSLEVIAQRSAKIEAGLDKARDRQRRLLPAEPPAVFGLDWGLLYRPSARVSGDFYDFVVAGPQSIAILVGDVSGHGIEAAILMGMAKKVLALRMRESADPAQALVQTNEDLRSDLDGRTFVSALAAVLHLGTRQLTVARAGHNPPLLVNPARDPAWHEIEPAGMVIGMADTERFCSMLQVQTVQLQRGDTVLCYTDGLTECEDPGGAEYGVDRVREFLLANGARPVQEILRGLQQDLIRFQGGHDKREDDLTAIGVRLS